MLGWPFSVGGVTTVLDTRIGSVTWPSQRSAGALSLVLAGISSTTVPTDVATGILRSVQTVAVRTPLSTADTVVRSSDEPAMLEVNGHVKVVGGNMAAAMVMLNVVRPSVLVPS